MCFQASKPQVQSGADTALQIIQTLMWSDIRSDTIELTMWAAQYTHMHVHTYIHTCLTLHTHIIYTYICSVQYACAVLHTYVGPCGVLVPTGTVYSITNLKFYAHTHVHYVYLFTHMHTYAHTPPHHHTTTTTTTTPPPPPHHHHRTTTTTTPHTHTHRPGANPGSSTAAMYQTEARSTADNGQFVHTRVCAAARSRTQRTPDKTNLRFDCIRTSCRPSTTWRTCWLLSYDGRGVTTRGRTFLTQSTTLGIAQPPSLLASG